jgi:hypothetical protein
MLLIDNQPCFFTVNHITKPFSTKLIYGISLNNISYFLAKSLGINDCEQLDSNALLDPGVLNEMCTVITEIELAFRKAPSLEFLNMEIFRKLIERKRLPVLQWILS